MNRSPEISVVMPVYNGENFLKEAIESILNQTYKDFEFLIVYDESTDGTLSIIQEFQEKDTRVVLINGDKEGISGALNKGIKKSRGKYIARLDADDISLATRFEKQIIHMEDSGVDICGGHSLLINSNGKINGLNVVPISHKMCALSLLFKVPFAHPSVMIRKRFLDTNSLKYGQSSYKIAEDLDLWLRMYGCGARFGNVDSVVLKYRILRGSLSKVNNALILEETKSMLHQFYKDNHQQISLIVKNLPSVLNSEEKSLLVRYIYKRVKRLDFSHVGLMRKVDKKIIFNSILSEMIR
jgi:glycosyltransferase involved in cell wall biosynthesis